MYALRRRAGRDARSPRDGGADVHGALHPTRADHRLRGRSRRPRPHHRRRRQRADLPLDGRWQALAPGSRAADGIAARLAGRRRALPRGRATASIEVSDNGGGSFTDSWARSPGGRTSSRSMGAGSPGTWRSATARSFETTDGGKQWKDKFRPWAQRPARVLLAIAAPPSPPGRCAPGGGGPRPTRSCGSSAASSATSPVERDLAELARGQCRPATTSASRDPDRRRRHRSGPVPAGRGDRLRDHRGVLPNPRACSGRT